MNIKEKTKKRNQHEWGFMGNGKQADLAYCSLCDRWTWFDGKLFKMTTKKYQEMLASEEITGV